LNRHDHYLRCLALLPVLSRAEGAHSVPVGTVNFHVIGTDASTRIVNVG